MDDAIKPAAGEPLLAVVTGGASGIGLAIVERLARDGFHTIMVDRNGPLAEEAAERLRGAGLTVEAAVLDITDEAGVARFVAGLAPITALVNNAGVFDERPFLDVCADDYRRAFEVNLVGMASLTREAARRMPRGAHVVNIASRAYLGARNHAHYVASKAAVVGFTRAAALELAGRDIAVNAVAPGLIDTPLLRALSPERMAAQLALQPTGQAGSPADVAAAVAFLASPATRFITGQVLFVDGGKSIGGAAA